MEELIIAQDREFLISLRQNLIDVNRFMSKVIALRHAQKNYLKDRSFSSLTQIKALEAEVDNRGNQAVKAASIITQTLNNIIDNGLNKQQYKNDFESSADSFRDSEDSTCTRKYERKSLLYQ